MDEKYNLEKETPSNTIGAGEIKNNNLDTGADFVSPDLGITQSDNSIPVPETKKVSSVRTYANDIALLVRKGATISGIAISEQKRKERVGYEPKFIKEEEERANKNKRIIFFAVIFILLGLIISIGAFLFSGKDEGVEQTLEIPSIVFSNSEKEILFEDFDRVSFLKRLNQERAGVESMLGSIANIYPVIMDAGIKRVLTSEEFLNKVSEGIEQSFVRSLGKTFMIGVHSFDGNQGFLIFEVDSFQSALPGALSWEKTMLDNLWPMFYGAKPEIGDGVSGSNKEGFKDVIVKNKDARELKDLKGETALIYSFPDRKHLVITTDRSTLLEVFERLSDKRSGN